MYYVTDDYGVCFWTGWEPPEFRVILGWQAGYVPLCHDFSSNHWSKAE